jgi:hypothetical protein
MMDNRTEALKLKEQGNQRFKDKDYRAAEACYSQAYVPPQ